MLIETNKFREMTGNEISPLSHRQQARTWSQIARLAGEAITALETGRTKDARDLLTAIRGVALNADREGV